MKKILLVFGTRPEAIKMAPLVNELKKRTSVKTTVCVTGQHGEAVDSVLDTFGITPDHDLAVMRSGGTLSGVTSDILLGMGEVLDVEKPDTVLVHGDTASAFASALACFYRHVPLGHVEAGLRTYDISSPYPEEFNRRAIGLIAEYHFAPTEMARDNLIREGKRADRVFVTGNTVIDAIRTTVRKDFSHPLVEWAEGSKLILLTAHRRENLGERMMGMFRGIRRVAEEENVKIIYPIHMNPMVREAASVLEGSDRIKITAPLAVSDFHNIMARSYMILTDSGGIQEEATYLGKPVLVMRDRTERPEGEAAGTLKTIGSNEETVYRYFKLLLNDREVYRSMSVPGNMYGNGRAAVRIADILEGKKIFC